MARQPDNTDLLIIRELQTDARQPNQDIATKIGIAPSTLTRRIQWLESQGIIKGYSCLVDIGVIGYSTTGYTLVKFSNPSKKHFDSLVKRLREVPEVSEICKIFGEGDLIVKLYAKDNDHYQRILEEIGPIEGDDGYQTTTLLVTQVVYDGGINDIVRKISTFPRISPSASENFKKS